MIVSQKVRLQQTARLMLTKANDGKASSGFHHFFFSKLSG